MSVQRASYIKNKAALSTDFGYKVACEKFGADLVDNFPRFSRGPRKGKLKGFLCWTKCTVGGWARLEGGVGRVVRPGTSDWCLAMAVQDYGDPKGHSVVARWDWNGGSPTVTKLQEPAAAEQLYKTYGTEARYA